MRTIPDTVLDKMAEHRPDLQVMIANLRAHPEHATQIERAIATSYLYGETRLSGLETWYLSQVSYGGPWGGDWWTLARAAGETGYDAGTLRRMIFEKKLSSLKYGKTHYIRRDALPSKE